MGILVIPPPGGVGGGGGPVGRYVVDVSADGVDLLIDYSDGFTKRIPGVWGGTTPPTDPPTDPPPTGSSFAVTYLGDPLVYLGDPVTFGA